MKHLFYFWALILLCYEFFCIFRPGHQVKNARELSKLHAKKIKYDQYNEKEKDLTRWTAVKFVFSFGWYLLGSFFSSQYEIILSCLLLQFLLNGTIGAITKHTIFYYAYCFFFSVLETLFLGYVILNAYHWHINTWDVIEKYLYNIF